MVDLVEGFLPVGVSGKNLDTTVVTRADGTKVHREAVVLTDPADNDARANVVATESDQYSSLVFSHELPRLVGLMRDLLHEQRLTNTYLSSIVGDNLGEH